MERRKLIVDQTIATVLGGLVLAALFALGKSGYTGIILGAALASLAATAALYVRHVKTGCIGPIVGAVVSGALGLVPIIPVIVWGSDAPVLGMVLLSPVFILSIVVAPLAARVEGLGRPTLRWLFGATHPCGFDADGRHWFSKQHPRPGQVRR